MKERHGPCGGQGHHGGPDDRHCIVCTDETCRYNRADFKARLETAGERVGKAIAYSCTRYPILFVPVLLLSFVLSPITTTKNVLGPSWRIVQEHGGVRHIVRLWWRNRG